MLRRRIEPIQIIAVVLMLLFPLGCAGKKGLYYPDASKPITSESVTDEYVVEEETFEVPTTIEEQELEAIRSLKSVIPGIRLRVTGKGSYLEEFLAKIQALGLEGQVQYLGYVPWAQLVEELRGADVGIVAQKSSLYSNLVHTGKMYDYLYFHKPVIASRLEAVNAYFDDESLCYFVPGDADDLARAVRYLYEHPEARGSFASNGRRLYNHYRWKRQRMAYLAVSRALAGLSVAEPTLHGDEGCP